MAFCGSCGKQADNSDRFCTSCGSQIKEVTISVVEELGQVIKEEYRESTVPPDANLSKLSSLFLKMIVYHNYYQAKTLAFLAIWKRTLAVVCLEYIQQKKL